MPAHDAVFDGARVCVPAARPVGRPITAAANKYDTMIHLINLPLVIDVYRKQMAKELSWE